MNDLPDCAASLDTREIAIDRVGIRNLRYPIQVLDRENGHQSTVATVSLSVSLASTAKGTHMSRFVALLEEAKGEVTIANMPTLLREVQNKLGASDAYIEVEFPYFVTKRAPVTQTKSLLEYPCKFIGEAKGNSFAFTLCVSVPVQTLCPCSKAISNYGAHNQRAHVDVTLQSSDTFTWIEDVINAVEPCSSTPLYALLKREDEKYVTEHAYDQPRFVEDLARESMIALKALPGVTYVKVQAASDESIHTHQAFAEITWSRT